MHFPIWQLLIAYFRYRRLLSNWNDLSRWHKRIPRIEFLRKYYICYLGQYTANVFYRWSLSESRSLLYSTSTLHISLPESLSNGLIYLPNSYTFLPNLTEPISNRTEEKNRELSYSGDKVFPSRSRGLYLVCVCVCAQCLWMKSQYK